MRAHEEEPLRCFACTPVVAAALVGMIPAAASAATLTVGTDYATLDEALVAAVDGDVIELPPGTWPVAVKLTNRDLTFVGLGGPAVTTVTSAGTAFELVDSTAVFESLTVDATGRAFEVTGGSLTLSEVVVTGNASGLAGSVVYADGATVDLVGVRFVDNGVSDLVDGGHVRVLNATLTVSDSVLTGGTAANGGLIAATDSALVVERSTFAAASASASGGAIWAEGGTVSVVDSRLVDNAALDGGHIAMDNGFVFVHGSQLARGDASRSGGSIYVDLSGASVIDSDITDSVAVESGAAIRAVDTSLLIHGSVLARNTAVAPDPLTDPGGIVSSERGSITAVDSAFVDGWSGQLGSAMHGWLTDITVIQSLFARNVDTVASGAVASSQADLSVERSWFVDNDASYAAAIWSLVDHSTNIRDNVFLGQSATSTSVEGGAVTIKQGFDAQLVRNYFCDNEGLWGGAAAFVSGFSEDIYVANNIIAGNVGSSSLLVDMTGAGNIVAVNNDLVGSEGAFAFLLGSGASSWEVVNNLFAFSSDDAVYMKSTQEPIYYSDLWDNGGIGWAAPGPGTISADPLLFDWSAVDDCLAHRFHRDPASPLVDAGAPQILDPDGSVSDIGAYGGPDAGQGILIDEDGDGYPGYVDCDDDDVAVWPGAPERCNRKDDDCDGYVDEDDAIDPLSWLPDLDLDGYGDDAAAATLACAPPDPTWVLVGGDCDDLEPRRHLDAREVCDGVDDDCDGVADEDAVDAISAYPDADGDGHGAIVAAVTVCEIPVGFAALGDDCDDASAHVYPDADELCDGFDGDCDGSVDDAAIDATTWYLDNDEDGVGDLLQPLVACDQPIGAVLSSDDCDDEDASVAPGLPETCDGRDEDCDLLIDEEPIDGTDWYADGDGDGYGRGDAVPFCDPPEGHATVAGDCDDTDATVAPGATEVCDGRDQDCDGAADEDAADMTTYYRDDDADGYGDPSHTMAACWPPEGYVLEAGDCDDELAWVYPAAVDGPDDGVDADCGGEPEDVEATEVAAGCGCNSATPGLGSIWAFGLALLALRRRR